MASISFSPRSLADGLSETAGHKVGLALSLEEICDHLSGTRYPDIIIRSEQQGARLRSEEYEDVFYKLLHRIGYTNKEFGGLAQGLGEMFHKYKKLGKLEELNEISELYNKLFTESMQEALKSKSKAINPKKMLTQIHKKYGTLGLEIAIERIEIANNAIFLSPHNELRPNEWKSSLALNSLFSGGKETPEKGKFLDQRFIDYLSNNKDRIPAMHWRKFEELTAEFYAKEGYQVDIGPGSNDDGVDVRAWHPNASRSESPLLIIQCKRQKEKVEKIVIKGLYADVVHEGAKYGVIVTTSDLSPGATNTITARGYPINSVNREGVEKWIEKLRSPGTGIVRV